MEKTKSVQSLKRQLTAAIAMVLVAAIALVSATYAWFVANNTVTAETATISAQSNAPFLRIEKGESTDITASSPTDIMFEAKESNGDHTLAETALYPAQVVKEATALGTGESTAPYFQSAYANIAGEATIRTGSRYNVGDADTAATATGDNAAYALKEVFTIGTADVKAGSFNNLKVSKVEVVGDKATDANGLKDAISVLLVCDTKWAVYKASNNGAVLTQYYDGNTNVDCTATDGVLATKVGSTGKNETVTVKAYVFYDGSAEKVYTDNIQSLKDCGIKLTFDATPVNTDGTENAGAKNPTE